MQNSVIEKSFINTCLGYSRHHCKQALLELDIDSVAFGHWLAIPSQQLLLVFRHQHCVAVDCYMLTA